MDSKTLRTLPHHLPENAHLRNRYRILGVLGEGGFGITYLSYDETLQLEVAIKEYFPRILAIRHSRSSTFLNVQEGEEEQAFLLGKERFLEEARVLVRFREEPNIISVFDYFEENGTAYIVMEYLEGEDLLSLIERRGRMPFSEAYILLKPVISALTRLHAAGLLHRDISPSNIRILPDGRIKLLDFGAVRSVDYMSDKSRTVLSKPGYSPPEQYRSRGAAGPWVDVYALCATLYHMITGTVPDDSLQRVLLDELRKPSELGADISPAEENVLLRGLAVDERNRFQSLDALQEAVEKAESGSSPRESGFSEDSSSGEPVLPEELPPKKRRRLPLIAALGTAALLLTIIAVIFFRRSAAPSDEPSEAASGETASGETASAENTAESFGSSAAASETSAEAAAEISHELLFSAWGAYIWSGSENVYMSQTLNGIECELRLFPNILGVDPKEPQHIYLQFSDRYDEPYSLYASYSLENAVLRLTAPSSGDSVEEASPLTKELCFRISPEAFDQGCLRLVSDEDENVYVDYSNYPGLISADRRIQGSASDPEHVYQGIYALDILLDSGRYQKEGASRSELLSYLTERMKKNPDSVQKICRVLYDGGGYTKDAHISGSFSDFSMTLEWSEAVIPYNGRMQEVSKDEYLHFYYINCDPFGFILYDNKSGEMYHYHNPLPEEDLNSSD